MSPGPGPGGSRPAPRPSTCSPNWPARAPRPSPAICAYPAAPWCPIRPSASSRSPPRARPRPGRSRARARAAPRPEQDRRLAEELLASPKDRAENLMIVDLMRNDLARACRPGTVKVEAFCALETYANVHHLVSTVTGRLQSGQGALDLFRGAFPAGSITGAPKIQAMREIARHETPRGPYCGSLFWAGFDGGVRLQRADPHPGVRGRWGRLALRDPRRRRHHRGLRSGRRGCGGGGQDRGHPPRP